MPASSLQHIFSRESLSHAVSGSLSSIVALAMVYPLDQVRILKQVEGGGRGVFAAEPKYQRLLSMVAGGGSLASVLALLESRGVAGGLYKGFYPHTFALGLSNFLYFYIYSAGGALASVAAGGGRSLTPLEDLAVTTVAGAANAVAAAPLWNVCDKIKTDSEGRYDGIMDCVRKLVVRACARVCACLLWGTSVLVACLTKVDVLQSSLQASDGAAAMWNGVQAALLLVSNPIIHYYCYSQVRLPVLLHPRASTILLSTGCRSHSACAVRRLTSTSARRLCSRAM
jgi:hypothetical protein